MMRRWVREEGWGYRRERRTTFCLVRVSSWFLTVLFGPHGRSSTPRWCRETTQSTNEHLSARVEWLVNEMALTAHAKFSISESVWVFVKAQRFLSARRMQPAVHWWLHSVDDASCWQWTWSEDASHNITAGRWEDTSHTHTQETCKHCVTPWHSVKVTSRSLFRLAIISDLSLQTH